MKQLDPIMVDGVALDTEFHFPGGIASGVVPDNIDRDSLILRTVGDTDVTIEGANGVSIGSIIRGASADNSITMISEHATSKRSSIHFLRGPATALWGLGNDSNQTGLGDFYLFDYTNSRFIWKGTAAGLLEIIAGFTIAGAAPANSFPMGDGTKFTPKTFDSYFSIVGGSATTSSTTMVMRGWGQFGAAITPSATGKIMVMATGTVYNDTGNCGTQIQLRYGTGTPPNANTAASGTSLGQVYFMGPNVGTGVINVRYSYTAMSFFQGVVGTTYWLDHSWLAWVGGISTNPSSQFSAWEFP